MTDYNYIGKIPFVNYKCDKMGHIFSMCPWEEMFFLAIPSVCRVVQEKCGAGYKIFKKKFNPRKSGNTPLRRCLKMSNNHKKSSAGKGYIALLLCAAAIGLAGFLYYRDAGEAQPQPNAPDVTVAATQGEQQQDVPVVAVPSQQTQPGATQPSTPVQPKDKTLKTASPVEGQTVAVYAMDALSYNQTTRDWRTHNGMDIAAEAGTQVCAAADGEVYTVFEDETMGMTVVIRHDGGYATTYASLAEEVLVKPGEQVKLGQAIGCVGSTALLETAIGDHVHFSVSCNDEPMDPMEFLNLK